MISASFSIFPFFFFNDTATTEIYTLSLHDALPISGRDCEDLAGASRTEGAGSRGRGTGEIRRPFVPRRTHLMYYLTDRKSTRLNSSHQIISYAVFCLKKKKRRHKPTRNPENSGDRH